MGLQGEKLGLVTGPSIMFIAPSAYPLGGVADWLEYVVAGLRIEGLVCQLGLVEGGDHDVARYLSRHPCANCFPISNQTGSSEGRIRRLMSAIDRAAPEIVVSVNLLDVYEAVRRLRARFGGGGPRVVMALHGLQADLMADVRHQSDVLDGVVTTNRLSAAMVADALGSRKRVHYAPYGVPTVVSSPRVRGAEVVFRLLYAGRIEQDQKRVFDLPPILRSLRASGLNARLSIAGGGPMERELRRVFAEGGLAESVEWLGDLSAAQLADAYRSHDALVITSVWETGPIVAWEAMSHGLPVASSRYVGSGLEGALVDGRTAVLFEIGDIEGAVAAIIRLRDSSVRREIVSAGLELVDKRYAREASVAAWKSALEAVLASPPLLPTRTRLSKPAGRLDRWFGVERAEDLRELFGIRFEHNSPGGAWPHSGFGATRENEFLEHAKIVDRSNVNNKTENY